MEPCILWCVTPVSIPLCHLPTTRRQVFGADCQRTEFQVRHLVQISQSPEFCHFILSLGADQSAPDSTGIVYPANEGTFNVCWCEKNGSTHGQRVGPDRIIQTAVPLLPAEIKHAALKMCCVADL